MSVINQLNIIRRINQHFGIITSSQPDELNQEEQQIFESILQQLEEDTGPEETFETLDVGEELTSQETDEHGEDIDNFGDPSSSPESASSQPSGSEYVPTPTTRGDPLEEDYLGKAYMYWNKRDPEDQPEYILHTSVPNGRRLFRSVQNRFNRLSNSMQLYRFETRLRKISMATINKEVYKLFLEKRSNGAIVHDRHLRMWALQIKARLDPGNNINFKASQGWVSYFRAKKKIVSRRITKRLTKTQQVNEEEIRERALNFSQEVAELINVNSFTGAQVFNIDQSRFEKEIHTSRTLATRGSQEVPALIGSTMATTHCYMIMPSISMDGTLHSPMYMLVGEPGTGKFPRTKQPDPRNIKSYASKTANMNKQDLKTFYQEVFWPSVQPQNILLLLDSWSANKDQELFNQCKPGLKEAVRKLIPEGGTKFVQPLDVYFFRPYKNFVKFITDSIIQESDFSIWQRDNFIKLQSFTHYQFSAERFRNLIKFAFFKAGYTSECPPKCATPIDYCFKETGSNCSEEDCSGVAFVRCAHCEGCFCLKHALKEKLHIDCVQ